jgi:hypothetical protein
MMGKATIAAFQGNNPVSAVVEPPMPSGKNKNRVNHGK